MGLTAEARISKRRINELEEKLKKLQRDIQQLKSERKKVNQIRKQSRQALRAAADSVEVLEYIESCKFLESTPSIGTKDVVDTEYKCRDPKCVPSTYNKGNCEVIEAGVRLIIVCRDCGSRYTLTNDRN
jgi:predicted nuclease with TOPRIM domain